MDSLQKQLNEATIECDKITDLCNGCVFAIEFLEKINKFKHQDAIEEFRQKLINNAGAVFDSIRKKNDLEKKLKFYQDNQDYQI